MCSSSPFLIPLDPEKFSSEFFVSPLASFVGLELFKRGRNRSTANSMSLSRGKSIVGSRRLLGILRGVR